MVADEFKRTAVGSFAHGINPYLAADPPAPKTHFECQFHLVPAEQAA